MPTPSLAQMFDRLLRADEQGHAAKTVEIFGWTRSVFRIAFALSGLADVSRTSTISFLSAVSRGFTIPTLCCNANDLRKSFASKIRPPVIYVNAWT